MIKRMGTLRDIASDVEDYLEEVDEVVNDVDSILEKVMLLLDEVEEEDENVEGAKIFLEEAIDKINDLGNNL